MMNCIFEAKNINKKFGDHVVLEDISFDISPGEIIGLVGRNGVGKTTLMKCILGLTKVDSGKLYFKGEEQYYSDKFKMDQIGYLLDCKLFENMSAYENIKIQEWYKGNHYKKAKERQLIKDILTLVDLSNDKKKVKQYSFGMKQRLGLALALLGDTKLLILDEPFVGLDPVGIRTIREFIIKICRERNVAILISSHQLSEIKDICDRFLFMSDKHLTNYIYDDRKRVEIFVSQEVPTEFESLLQENEGIVWEKNKIVFWFTEKHFNTVMKYFVEHKLTVKDITIQGVKLDSLFVEEEE